MLVAVPTAVTVFVVARRDDVWVEGASSMVLTTLASVVTLRFCSPC